MMSDERASWPALRWRAKRAVGGWTVEHWAPVEGWRPHSLHYYSSQEKAEWAAARRNERDAQREQAT